MTFEAFEKLLETAKEKLGKKVNGENLRQELSKRLKPAYKVRTVLGIDIYKYSQMSIVPQSIVPFVLQLTYKNVVQLCLNQETFIFSGKSERWFLKNRIDNGDGYFQLFDNPLQALAFLIHFEAHLKILNSMSVGQHAEIAMIFEETLIARYAITMGPVFEFGKNSYGQGIIDCARIISKDKLNRLLIDGKVNDFFVVDYNGLETLQVLGLDDLKKTKNPEFDLSGKSILFHQSGGNSAFRQLNVQQIEKVTVKEDSFKIFNLYVQVFLTLREPIEIEKHIVSVGNLNTTGL